MAYSTKCVFFDGVNEYATAASSSVLSKEYNSAFSVSLWIAAGAYATGNYILGKMGGSPQYRGWGIYLDGAGTLGVILRSDDSLGREARRTFSLGALTGAWAHIVVTYSGSGLAAGIKAYKNGVELTGTTVSDALGSNTIVNAVNFWLGGAVSASAGWIRNFLGAQASVYARALTLAEVQWIYNSKSPRDLLGAGAPSDVEAWWKCGTGDTHPTLLDSSGVAALPTIPERSGSGYNGTAANMDSTDIIVDSPGGVHSIKCLEFDGVNESVSAGNVLSFERTNPFSFSFWFKCSAPGTYYVPLSKLGVSLVGYQVSIDSSGRIELWLVSNLGGGNYLEVRTVAGYADASWHHCVISFSGSSLASGVTIYVDGSPVSTTAVVDALTGTIVNTNNFILGGRDDGFYFYAGRLDEVTVYSRALTASEVIWIRNGGVPIDPRVTGAPSGLVAWWPLGEGTGTPVGNLTMTNMESTDVLNDSPDFWYGQVEVDQGIYALDEDGHEQITMGGGGGTTTTLYFKMRAQDSGASPPGYVTWVVADAPDFAGLGYGMGSPTPVSVMVPGSVVVTAQWEEVV